MPMCFVNLCNTNFIPKFVVNMNIVVVNVDSHLKQTLMDLTFELKIGPKFEV